MSADNPERLSDPLAVLRRFARRPIPAESCEFCRRAVPSEHQHLIERGARRLICVCEACAILFPGGHDRYQRVPRDLRSLPHFHLTDAQWEGLLIPIGMAFFYRSGEAGRVVAVYPSPAGPTESQLPLETWDEIAAANPALASLQPDVEALVVNRLGASTRESGAFSGQPHEYYILPIDHCFRLVGLLRLHWKGLAGGAEVWTAIAGFFADVRARARPAREVARA